MNLFGDEYLKRPTLEDLQRLLDIGEKRGFPGMVGSIDCMHWESITLPQCPKQELFAKVQEATRKDVERAFGCGARFWSIASSICDCEKPGAFMGQGKDRDDYENMYHTTQYDSRK